MKLRLYRSHMQKALLWYTEELTKKHMGSFLTPARIEVINIDLKNLQALQQKRESNSVWKVPVELSINENRNTFEVVVASEKNLLYLD